MHRVVELFARQAEPRVRRVERNRERIGNFGHRAAVDFVQDEHGAFFQIERFERELSQAQFLGSLQTVERSRRGIVGVRVRVQYLAPCAEFAAVVGGHAKRKAEQPRPYGPGRVVSGELFVDTKEHVMREVLEIAFGDAEAAQ